MIPFWRYYVFLTNVDVHVPWSELYIYRHRWIDDYHRLDGKRVGLENKTIERSKVCFDQYIYEWPQGKQWTDCLTIICWA